MPWHKSTKNRFDSRFCLQQVSPIAQQRGIDKLAPIKVDAVDFCGDGKQSNVIGVLGKIAEYIFFKAFGIGKRDLSLNLPQGKAK